MSSSRVITLHDRRRLAAWLRRNIPLHLYSLGDLDAFFWPYTIWYGLESRGGQLEAVCLLYTRPALPVLLALGDAPDPLATLLQGLSGLLPLRCYAHLSPGMHPALTPTYQIADHGLHYKMMLETPDAFQAVDVSHIRRLTPADEPALQALYAISYPDNAFDPWMLATGHTYGRFIAGQLRAVAGIHVYSRRYGVAALGNITVHPADRGQGHGRAVTARLCQALYPTTPHIGLNVKADNLVAQAVYTRLGFRRVALYEEVTLTHHTWRAAGSRAGDQ